MNLRLDIQHDFGGFTLDAQMTANAGTTVLFGRSGSGKTSLSRNLPQTLWSVFP